MIITESSNRLRCRHCHLTLKAEELEGGYCPECLAVSGRKRDDFEKIETTGKMTQYRCEDCGARLTPVGA
jgi:Zn finger protein HypA/HybF involved in hydrogenase expression